MKKYIQLTAAALTGSMLTAATAAVLVHQMVIQPFRKDAVDRGFADWAVVDNATGKTRFQWNELAQGLHAPQYGPDLDEIEKPLAEKPLAANTGKKGNH